MSTPVVFSLPSHPNISRLVDELGYVEHRFTSIRNTMGALKKTRPDFIIADFHFAYANNYASNHISNLDSLLITLQKYPDYQPVFIFLAAKNEIHHVEELLAQYPGGCRKTHSLAVPVTDKQIRMLLENALP